MADVTKKAKGFLWTKVVPPSILSKYTYVSKKYVYIGIYRYSKYHGMNRLTVVNHFLPFKSKSLLISGKNNYKIHNITGRTGSRRNHDEKLIDNLAIFNFK